MKRNVTACCILLLMLACAPADLQRVAQGLDALAVATGTAQTTIIQMEADKLIDVDTTRAILEAFLKVNQAQKQAIAITRNLTQLDGGTTKQLVQIMGPITASVNELVANGAAGIKNPDTKQKVLAVLVTVQSVISAINLSLAGR
jgi:hypothetical protein